jgi:hypothetical protein
MERGEMTQMLSDIDAAHLTVGPTRKSANGVMIQPVLYKGERGVDIQLPECTCLFPPSGFDQSSARLSVTFRLDEQTAQAIGRVEAAVAAAADIKSLHSALKQKEGFDPTFRCKIDDKVQFVDSKGAELKAMPEWRGLRLRVIVSPRSVYHQPLCAGIVWDLVAVQVLGPVPIKRAMFL